MFTSLRQQPLYFYRRLWTLAAPIVLQNLITTSLGFVDTFMVGLLGNAEMAAVNAANTPIFIVQVVIFGFQSGMTVLVSQTAAVFSRSVGRYSRMVVIQKLLCARHWIYLCDCLLDFF